MVTPAGTARAEDPLGQVIFLTKLAEAVPAASTHRQAIREKQQQTFTAPLDGKGFFSSSERVRGGSTHSRGKRVASQPTLKLNMATNPDYLEIVSSIILPYKTTSTSQKWSVGEKNPHLTHSNKPFPAGDGLRNHGGKWSKHMHQPFQK
ncbi:hypothetical protein [Halobacillus sp. H74]|uniref:hypothetical protein n=1 Tax=Halobacillus sp. H74 TaxID=3457436 RepID=UPI003FCEB825